MVEAGVGLRAEDNQVGTAGGQSGVRPGQPSTFPRQRGTGVLPPSNHSPSVDFCSRPGALLGSEYGHPSSRIPSSVSSWSPDWHTLGEREKSLSGPTYLKVTKGAQKGEVYCISMTS